MEEWAEPVLVGLRPIAVIVGVTTKIGRVAIKKVAFLSLGYRVKVILMPEGPSGLYDLAYAIHLIGDLVTYAWANRSGFLQKGMFHFPDLENRIMPLKPPLTKKENRAA